MAISPIDAIVIAVYLVGITAFGIKVGYRRNASSQQYFLANKSLGWFTVGAAVFTSNISTIHLVGYAAGGARDGLVIGNFEWMACFILILLALMFAPFYINSGVATAVDALAVGYIQNTGWTPDGRDYFGNAWAIGRGAMPDGLAVHTHVVAENDRIGSLSVWDGTVTATGHEVDFASADFLRIENGVAAEHWDTVDYVQLYQSFGLLPDDL